MNSDTASTELTDRIETYFRDVDRFDTDAIMSNLTEDCVVEVVTDGVVREGLDEIRATYDRRAQVVKESWHGNLDYTIDLAKQQVATRLTARRTNHDGSRYTAANLTRFDLENGRIKRIAIWMSGENTLV